MGNSSSSSPDCWQNMHKSDVFVTSEDTGEEKSNRGNKAAQNWSVASFQSLWERRQNGKKGRGEKNIWVCWSLKRRAAVVPTVTVPASEPQVPLCCCPALKLGSHAATAAPVFSLATGEDFSLLSNVELQVPRTSPLQPNQSVFVTQRRSSHLRKLKQPD